MVKYYEKAKSQHARDIDHLVTFNNNGLWIKEIIKNGNRIISAENIEGTIIKDTVIYEFDKNYIYSFGVNIKFCIALLSWGDMALIFVVDVFASMFGYSSLINKSNTFAVSMQSLLVISR